MVDSSASKPRTLSEGLHRGWHGYHFIIEDRLFAILNFMVTVQVTLPKNNKKALLHADRGSFGPIKTLILSPTLFLFSSTGNYFK